MHRQECQCTRRICTLGFWASGSEGPSSPSIGSTSSSEYAMAWLERELEAWSWSWSWSRRASRELGDAEVAVEGWKCSPSGVKASRVRQSGKD